MKLKLRRIAKRQTYTIGYLYMQDRQNGEWVKIADTLEDRDRGLDQSMTEANIARIKVKHKTAIPTGTYEIIMNVVSGTFAKKQHYKEFCGGKLPRLKYVKGFSGILIHCLTPDMEILTENGWQDMESFKNNPAKMCYSYNTESGMAELVPIDDYIEQDYDGKIYCCNSRRISYSVTNKHRMWVGSRVHGGGVTWGFRTADDIKSQPKFLTSAYKEGEALTAEQKTIYRLVMATQADGYILNYSARSSAVRFHFVKERKINRIKELVEQIGHTYNEFIDNEGKTHITLDGPLSNQIAEFMNPLRLMCNTKELPIELLNLRSDDLKDLLMEYLFWDGRWENYCKNHHVMVISSVNTRTLGVLQAMASLCGVRSHFRESNHCYELVLYDNQTECTIESECFKTEDYNGKVWCISNKNTTLIVRRRGRTMIIGNCGYDENDSSGCILVGENKVVGKIINSWSTFKRVYGLLKAASDRGEKITLTIQ